MIEEQIDIKKLIYEVGGKEVMLDSDLAYLLGYKNGTKDLNKMVKRNIDKFDDKIYFRISKDDYDKLLKNYSLRFQKENTNKRRFSPYVFTKKGVETLLKLIKNKNIMVNKEDVIKAFDKENKYSRNPVNIRELIYEIDGKEVMLDSDLAYLYGCKNGTKEINQAVKNNPEKFPERYCFKVPKTINNCNLRSKILTTNNMNRSVPTLFTEQGIYMLATILKTKKATEATIRIMDTFVNMRKLINQNKDILKRMISYENKNDYIEKALKEQKNRIDELFNKFERKENVKSKLFFNGQIYDSYSLLVDIITSSKENMIIIDNYVDKVVLDILSKKNDGVNVTIVTDKSKCRLTNTDLFKFNKEYPKLVVIYDNTFHDRFIIIDDKDLYHIGSSLKDVGCKTFAINKIEDKRILVSLLENYNK